MHQGYWPHISSANTLQALHLLSIPYQACHSSITLACSQLEVSAVKISFHHDFRVHYLFTYPYDSSFIFISLIDIEQNEIKVHLFLESFLRLMAFLWNDLRGNLSLKAIDHLEDHSDT